MTTMHTNDGRGNKVSVDLAALDLDGIHTIKKPLSDGTIALYFRHRKTNEKLVGVPGTADFEALRKQLDARVGRQKVERATLAGLIDAYTASSEYDDKVTSKSHRDNDARIFAQIKAARVTNDAGILLPALGETPTEHLVADGFYHAVMKYRDNLVQARKAAGQGMREVDAQMTALCALFAWAVSKRKLTHHPIGKYVKLYRSERVNVIFEPEHIVGWLAEVRKGDAAWKCADVERVFLLAITLGQRAGDLRSLLWRDYVVDRRTGARGFQIWPLKTRKHNKPIFVPVLPWVGDILDSMRGQDDERILTLRGKPWAPRTLSYYFGNVTRDAKLFATIESKDAKGNRVRKQLALHMHDLRGTAITWLAIAGNSERQIASITGHSPEYISEILNQYVAPDTRIAVSAIANLAQLPEVQLLQEQLGHLAPRPQLTYQPANDELPDQLIELQAAE